MKKEKLEKLLEYYEIESIDEFEPKFYTMNLICGRAVEKQAIKNLYSRGYTNYDLIQIENYDEIGIVESVAEDNFDIIDNTIVRED